MSACTHLNVSTVEGGAVWVARFSDWRYIPLFSYRKVDWRTNAVVMRRLLIPFSFHFQPSELQRTTIGIISFLTIFIRGRPAVFHLHFLSPSVVFSNLFSFYMGGGQTLVPELSHLSLEYFGNCWISLSKATLHQTWIYLLEYLHFPCSQLLSWIEIWSSERLVATDPHCEEVVEMCVKGGTRNSGPYVLPTSHPCNHQSEVVRVRSLCGAYYSRPRPMLADCQYVVDTDLTSLDVSWSHWVLSHFPPGNHSLSLRFNYSKCWLFITPQEKCWFLRVPRHF